MRNITCAKCGTSTPRGSAFGFRGAEYCEPCSDELRGEEGNEPGEFSSLVDPSLCALCGADSGGPDHPVEMGLHLCAPCATRLYQAPLPNWVKAFLAAVAAVLLLCGFLNLPYYRAYVGLRAAGRAAGEGDFAKASAVMGAAAAALPSNAELRAVAGFYRGYASLQEGDEAAALEGFRVHLATFPDSPELLPLVRQLEASQAFEAGDYRGFYRIQSELAAASPGDAMLALGKASAAACLWAAYDDPAAKAEAEAIMAGALADLPGEGREEALEYAKRIRFRLDAKRIIDRDEYLAEFPEEASE